MSTAKSWTNVKAAAEAAGTITEEHRRDAAARTEQYVQAHRLSEIRHTRRLTQVQLAEAMHVTNRASQRSSTARWTPCNCPPCATTCTPWAAT